MESENTTHNPPLPSTPGAEPSSCANHPEQPATRTCVDCHRSFCTSCGFNWEGDFICNACIKTYQVQQKHSPEEEATVPPITPRQIFSPRTVLHILLAPRSFFSRMPVGRGIGEPILFALIWGIIIQFAAIPSLYLTHSLLFRFMEQMVADAETAQNAEAPAITPDTPAEPDRGAGNAPISPSDVEFLRTYLDKTQYLREIQNYPLVMFVNLVELIFRVLLMVLIQNLILRRLGFPSLFEVTARIGFFSVVGIALSVFPIPVLAYFAGWFYHMTLNGLGIRAVYGSKTVVAMAVAFGSWFIARFLVFFMILITG